MQATFQTKERRLSEQTSSLRQNRKLMRMEISQEKMPSVSIVRDEMDLSPTYGKEKLPKSFEEMQRHGVKITSWEERIG
jgi:hypothetical protein